MMAFLFCCLSNQDKNKSQSNKAPYYNDCNVHDSSPSARIVPIKTTNQNKGYATHNSIGCYRNANMVAENSSKDTASD